MKKNKTCLFSSENGQNVTITAEQQIEIEEDFESTEKCGSASDSSAVSLYTHWEDTSGGMGVVADCPPKKICLKKGEKF